MNIIKLIVLLTITLTCKSIVFSQNFSTDSLKCFTYSQVRKITAEIKKAEVCDSIIQTQQLQIINFKEVLSRDNQIILENNKRLSELTKQLNRTELKLKISKRLNFYGVPIALGVGLITSIVLF
jgi:hypothetical protein